MPDYRYTEKEFETELGPCVYSIENLDLTEYGLPGLSFTGELEIEIDRSSGEDEWYIESATAQRADGVYHIYRFTSPHPGDGLIFNAIQQAVCKDQNLCDYIRDECKEHA